MELPVKPPVPFRGLYLAAVAVWLLLTFIGYAFVIHDSIEGVSSRFARQNDAMLAELRDKLKANEAVLAGFSGFLSAIEANDRGSVRHYASQMLAAYPHIYALEVVREVRDEHRLRFESHLRKYWGPSFQIRTYSYGGSRSWSMAPAKSVYQPIVFIWPETEVARPVVGLDMESVPHLRQALSEARLRRVAISSDPFMLIQGETGYVMFRHTDRSALQSLPRPEYAFAGPLTALLVMKAAALLPSEPAPLTARRLQVIRSGKLLDPPLYDLPAEIPPSRLESLLFPALSLRTGDFGSSQPMQLLAERQIRFSDMNGVALTLVSLFSLLFLVLLVAYLRGHKRNVEYALALERQAEYLALHDPLTGLPNRYLLEDRVRQALATWRRHGIGFAFLFLDLDRFKDVNDNHGHATGDELLCTLSGRLTEAVRESDTVARYGGDEFIILISGVVSDDDVVTVSSKVLNAVARPFELDGVTVTIKASLGMSRCPQDGQDFAVLFRQADAAMYGVKRDRRAVDGALRMDVQESDR
jgi:diguanylate cyclase (GGDEF)-like protein